MGARSLSSARSADRGRSRPRRTLALLAVGALLGLTSGCTGSSIDTQRLDDLFSEAVPDDQPGCSAALYDDDAIVWTGVGGLDDVEDQLLITEDTVFSIGQTSAQFTATAVLLLAEEGRLDLNDSLRSHLPVLPEWADSVTLEQVLHRTDGIRDYVYLVPSEDSD